MLLSEPRDNLCAQHTRPENLPWAACMCWMMKLSITLCSRGGFQATLLLHHLITQVQTLLPVNVNSWGHPPVLQQLWRLVCQHSHLQCSAARMYRIASNDTHACCTACTCSKKHQQHCQEPFICVISLLCAPIWVSFRNDIPVWVM